MPKNIKSKFVFLIAIVLIISACSALDSKKIDPGFVEDSVYQSDYFNFTLQIDPDLYVLSPEEIAQFNGDVASYISGGDDELKQAVDYSKKSNVFMFYAFEHNPLMPGEYEFNQNLIITAYKMSFLNNIKTEEEYFEIAEEQLKSIPTMSYDDFPEQTEIVTLDGVEFKEKNIIARTNGYTVNQRYLAKIVDDYVLSIVISYSDDTDLVKINNTLESFKQLK